MKKLFMRLWVLLSLSICTQLWAQETRPLPWSMPLGVDHVWLDDYPVAYQQHGRGQAVVLVHGSMGDYRTWAAQVPELSRHYRVYNLSLPRYYPEKWNGVGDRFGITEHAKVVADFIQHMGLGKVHLVGHSRGGAVAIKVATHYPKVIKTLVLADASGMENLLPGSPEGQQLLAQSKKLRQNLIDAIQRGELEKGAEQFTDALGGTGTWQRRTPDQRAVVMDNLGTALGDSGPRPTTACEDIARWNFPILLIHGARSPARYAAMGEAARGCNPSIGPARVIPGAAHSMNRENPTDFNREVLGYWAKH